MLFLSTLEVCLVYGFLKLAEDVGEEVGDLGVCCDMGVVVGDKLLKFGLKVIKHL